MKFKTLYADPPWHFDDRLDPTRRKPYDTLTLEELMELPISQIMDSEAHFYLWSTSSHIHDALHLMNAWGFAYKTIIPWIKRTKEGKTHFGMGHYFRAAHEPCLFGVRGGLKTNTNNTRNVLFARSYSRERHSSKPVEMYRLIEKNSPGPYLELFSRVKRHGWVMVGDEVDGQDIGEALQAIREGDIVQSVPSLKTLEQFGTGVPPKR